MPEEKKIATWRRVIRYIVNSMVYFVAGIIFLLMIFFGISQTTLFKEWLRDTLVETVNKEINGELSVQEIDGTIFTSLMIKNAVLTSQQKDTVVSVGYIELRTSPLKLLFKNIYARHIELRDVNAKLIEEEDGELNLLKIFPPSEEPEDTVKSEFPFTITVASLELNNINFSFQKYSYVGSTAFYPSMNFDDLRIRNLNLLLSAYADLNKYDYQLQIDKFSFEPNFTFFILKNLSGRFLLTNNAAGIDNLNIETDDTEINLSAGITYVDFLENFSEDDLKVAPLRIDLDIKKFNFNSIATFVPDLEILGGDINGKLSVAGTLNDLRVKKLELYTGQTSIVANAQLKNLLGPDSLRIEASLDNSYIFPPDIKKILKMSEMSDYREFGIVRFNELRYIGSTSSFTSTFSLDSQKGKLRGKSFMDFSSDNMKYDAELFTENLDLSAFTDIPSKINSKIKIFGEGTDISTMNTKVEFDALNSSFGQLEINSFQMNASAEDKRLQFDLNLLSDTANVSLNGLVDFINQDDPYHKIQGHIFDLNLAKLLNDQSLYSRINIEFDEEGRGFNPDSIDLFLVTDIKKSFFTEYEIDSTRLILDVRRNENGIKVINLVSDIADITLQGDFYITTLAKAFAKESQIITNQIKEKLNPVLGIEEEIQTKIVVNAPAITNSVFYADILLDFKEFVPLKINSNEIEIGGIITGKIEATSNTLELILNSDLKYLKLLSANSLVFLTESKFDINLLNERKTDSTYYTEIKLRFNSDRIYAGTNFYKVRLNAELRNDALQISSGGFIQNNLSYNLNARGKVYADTLLLTFSDLNLIYKGIPVQNRNDLSLYYSKGDFIIGNFVLDAARGKIIAEGKFGESDNGKLNLKIQDISSELISEKLLSLSPENFIHSNINILGELTGNISNPVFNIDASIKDIVINEKKFGSLIARFDYSNNLLNTDLRIVDRTEGVTVPELSITGYIPLNLTKTDSLTQAQKEMNLHVESDNFNLASLGNLIPTLEIKSGILETEIYIEGEIDNPIVTGYLSFNSARVKSLFNNLTYNFDSKIYWDNEEISFESISLSNEIGTKNGGTIAGSGNIILNKFSPSTADFKFKGDLKLLDKISKEVNPNVYGDLAISTRGDVTFEMNPTQMNLNMPISVTVADLVFPLSKSAYSGASDFKYKWISYDSSKSIIESQLDSLLMEFEKREIANIGSNGKRIFNYTIDVKLDTEAKMVLMLAKELNQDLTAVLTGNVILTSVDGMQRTSGQFNLLEGSKLTFIKTFEATGNIKFENINNPLLDITATYKDYYYPLTETGTASEQEVAIKIKLKGPLSELNQNFVKDPENIGVYIGTENIQKDQRDPTKTPSDAVFFIIAGKFTDGATTQERDAVASTATNLAGSVLGGVLNQFVGDYVRSIQLRQIGSETKFSLIGRVGDFRYEIGGTTEVFQDLSRANVKINWPITKSFLLKLERKESFISQSVVNAELYNEIGIKYLFEF
uniref:Translocation/assembly module TamB n=1 Tax=Ignavibacterium album TaxID=591197 RepID=A0A832G8H0_9BACT